MSTLFKKSVTSFLKRFDYRLQRISANDIPVEACSADQEIVATVKGSTQNSTYPMTMVSDQQLYAALSSIQYIVENSIPGDIVECGVWRGGCSIAMALKLRQLNDERKLWLFDTFSGMTEPTINDVHSQTNTPAFSKYFRTLTSSGSSWCAASSDEVLNNLRTFNLLPFFRLVEGDVQQTLALPSNLPDSISLLRLDTDWYESTLAELNVLYPLVVPSGVILLDDYGHWSGARKAVDQFFAQSSFHPLLWKTDYAGRGFIKNLLKNPVDSANMSQLPS